MGVQPDWVRVVAARQPDSNYLLCMLRFNKLPSVTLLLLTLFVTSVSGFHCKITTPEGSSAPVKHELWDSLLKKHVNVDGFVDYKGIRKDSVKLNEYLALLASAHPNKNWSRNEQMAYWINAYNAYTVQLVASHYPVESIKDIRRGVPFINSVWDIQFIEIEGKEYDLNNLEHGILRSQFKDARIHFAINCASFSCPKLRTEAYVAEKLEEQLEDAATQFINDPDRNIITSEQAEISSIFSWFRSDFKRDAGSVRAYINQYAETPLSKEGALKYMPYNWSINDQK